MSREIVGLAITVNTDITCINQTNTRKVHTACANILALPEAPVSGAFLLPEEGCILNKKRTAAIIVAAILGLASLLYLGASDTHLAAGAAVLGNTSAPIGGANTNCVIAGHRGWRGADYFRHIDKLAVGDEVVITNLWETLAYTVADIQIIQPHEVEKIKIQPNRDLLTLLTCHPYASGGKQRYVVYCERTTAKA